MGLDQNQQIRLYARRLVNLLVPVDFGEEYIESVSAELLQYLQPSSSKLYNIYDITNKLKTEFISNDRRVEWISIEGILESLLNSKSPSQVSKYLVFLDLLRSSHSFTNNRNHTEILNSTTHETYHPSYKESTGISLESVTKPYYETLPEDSILTYLSYTLLGSDSKLLSFSGSRKINLPSGINNSYSGLLQSTLEAALLYKNLAEFVQSKKGRLGSPIKTAFVMLLNTELSSYVDHINGIFKKKPSSMISVYADLVDWILRLRLLHLIVSLLDLNGYEFLSKVYELSKFGDIRIRDISKRIFSTIVLPYYEMIENWILTGELIDKSDEFFIRFNTSETSFNSIIEFLPSRIPFFIGKDLSRKFFQIGKMVIYLSQYCKELLWVNDYQTKYSKFIYDLHGGLKQMTVNLINGMTNIQYLEILNYFTFVIQGKEQLYLHLLSLRNFMLMRSNDLIERLILEGSSAFNDSASNISTTSLSKIVTESINHSTAKYSKFCDRLDARLLISSHGHVVWEVFTLDYKIEDLPISTILKPNMVEYLKLFNFLWKTRHFQFLINQSFVDSCNMRKTEMKKINSKYYKLNRTHMGIRDKKITWLVKSFNTISMIRYRVSHFLNVLIYYTSFDAVERNFNEIIVTKLFKQSSSSYDMKHILPDEFMKSLGTSNIGLFFDKKPHNMNELTIDELLDIHATYLKLTLRSPLFNESILGKFSGKSYIEQIYSILEIIFNFVISTNQYNDLLTNYIAVLNIEENSMGNFEIEEDLTQLEESLRAVVDKIYRQMYLSDYQVRLKTFSRDLKSDHIMRDLSRSL